MHLKFLRTVQSAECDVRVCSDPFKSHDSCLGAHPPHVPMVPWLAFSYRSSHTARSLFMTVACSVFPVGRVSLNLDSPARTQGLARRAGSW